MKFNDKLITAIAAIVVGVLFIALKGDVLSIAFTVLGAALIVMGILDAAKKDSKSGTVKIVAGLVTVLLGWTLVSITLYIVAALMILYCLMNLVSSLKTDGYSMSTVQKLRTYAKPVIGLAAGICLLLNQGGTVSWVFIFTGIVFIAEGIMMLAECKNNSLLKGEHKIESETERKNQRVTLRRSSNHRNCSDAQYFLGSDGAWQHCYVPYRSGHADRRNGIFQLGAEMAMTPIGEGVGVQISKMKKLITVLLTGFVMGVIITVSEPDLQVLAGQVPSVPNAVLIMTVAIGVGLFLALAIVRIRYKISLPLLIICYAALILISLFVPKEFLAVAFDSGGVTTGPMTVPFIMAMGVGLASVRSDKNAASDSFGLVALSSVGPILAVLILGCFYKPTEAAYTLTDVATVVTTQDVARVFAQGLPLYAKEVLVSLLPIIAVFLIFQMMTRRYQKRQIKRIAVGFAYTYIGLVLFLCGANVGFAPLGSYLGKELTGVSFRWILIPIGMLIGYYIVKAEPAIQVLNHQVETVTNGAISVKMMNRCMSIGVAVSVGLAMLRVLTGISIQWFVIPGYLIALVLSRFVPDIFIGIAFDSGGVASGPMTSTFLLPLSIGVCEALGGNLMTDAFGVVALVALTPLIAIQLMGLVYKLKTEKRTSTGTAEIADDCDAIVDLEEGE